MPFGVDEAGRGPVLGSMFAAAVWVEDTAVLPSGVADSKTLTPEKREAMAGDLRTEPSVHLGVAEVRPATIDAPETDMNTLTVEAHARAIERAVPADGSPTGLCDACDTDAERFAGRVRAACDRAVSVTARHGADEDSPLVGAASIVAKVERDAHVATLATEYGDVGSGYPSDPTTRTFLESYLEANGEFPGCARTTWSTCETLLARTNQETLDGFSP